MVNRRRGRPRKRPPSEPINDVGVEAPLDKPEEAFLDKVARQSAAVRALRDAQLDRLRTLIRLLRSEFNKEQSEVPVSQFFKEYFPDLCIVENGTDVQYEVRFKEKDGNLSMNHIDEYNLHGSLLHRLSSAYPDYFVGKSDGFAFSTKSVKTGAFGADKLQIRSLGALAEPSDSQTLVLKEGLQTPDVNNSGLSVGMTLRSSRVPKHGEMLLSVHGSPLGVYKEDNMETIEETEDMIG